MEVKIKIKKKYIGFPSGFIRFNKFEINYSFLDWSLPLSITFSSYLVFIRVFFVSVIINR